MPSKSNICARYNFSQQKKKLLANSIYIQCKALLMNRSENPICKNIKEKCPYIEEGCKLSYGSEEMKQHVEECKFRAYRCVGSTLGAWMYKKHKISCYDSNFGFAVATGMEFKWIWKIISA